MRFVACFLLAACSYRPDRLGAQLDDAGNPIDPDALIDGLGPTDGPGAFTCPASYDVTIAATPGSRYRIISTNATFWSHRTSCNESEATHLAVLDSVDEAAQLKAAASGSGVPQPSNSRFYLGAIQDPNTQTVGAGWIWITGAEVPPAMWGTFNGAAQPDDGVDDNEVNHDEQLAAFDPTVSFLIDVRGSTGYGAICECDGLRETATATARIDADPNNPN